MIKFPIKAKSQVALERQATPGPAAGGQSQATYDIIFDTATYTSAATVTLQFFNAGRATTRLTNFAGRGAFPTPQYFECAAITVDMLIPPGATAIQDMWSLLYGTGAAGIGGPTIQVTYADKNYGPWPLSMAHGTGGVTGFHTVTNLAFANNSMPDGGIWLGDSITFKPNQRFSVDMTWDAPNTLAANRNIRVNLIGTLHRAIV